MASRAETQGPGHVLACLAPFPLKGWRTATGSMEHGVAGAFRIFRRGLGWRVPSGRMATWIGIRGGTDPDTPGRGAVEAIGGESE